MEQVDALWKYLDRLNKNDPGSYLETIEKLKKEQEAFDKQREQAATKLVGEIRCRAEKLGDIRTKFVIKLCGNEKAPYPVGKEPIRLCLAHEDSTGSMLIIVNNKMIDEIYAQQSDVDLFLEGLPPFILSESGWKVSKLTLDQTPEGKGEVVTLRKPKSQKSSGQEPDIDLLKAASKSDEPENLVESAAKLDPNLDLVEKLKEMTGAPTADAKRKEKKKDQKGQKRDGPIIKIHDDSGFHIAESKLNRLQWIDGRTARLALPGHTTVSRGVEIEATPTCIKVATSAPTNLLFQENLQNELTVSQVDGIKVKFKKQEQAVIITIPDP